MDPGRLLKLGPIACGLALAGTLVLANQPCLGDQIVAVTDRNGHTVYINTGTQGFASPWSSRGFGSVRPEADPARTQKIDSVIEQVAGRQQVDPQLVRSIVSVESDYDPRAVSDKGAMGLMQLMPGTARDLGVTNPFDVRQNIEGGVSYLKYLLKLFGGDVRLSLAAYNAGQNSVLRSGGVPAIPETQSYVRKVTRLYQPGPDGAAGKRFLNPAPIIRYVDTQGVVHFTNTQ